MSLRWRLALALALLAAAAASVSAVVAYAATDNRLSAQIDHSLEMTARQLSGPGARGAGAAPFPPPLDAPGGGILSTPPAPPADEPRSAAAPSPGGAGALLDLVVVQHLDPAGAVLDHTPSAIILPVTAGDRSIAAGGGGPWLRTEEVDHSAYRVITSPRLGGGAVQVAQSLVQTDGALSTLRWLFTLLAAVITLLAAGLGWLIARRITGPLEDLTSAAESVAGGGTLERSVPDEGNDEVGRLGRAFSTMLGALSTSRRQQHRLVEDAGHELRTPLTSLRANIDLLRRHGNNLQPAALAHLLSDLDGELRELTDLVDEVVELATDSRDSEPVAPVQMDEVVERVAERTRARSGRRVTVHTTPWSVRGRSRSLERAVNNLVDNAAKFSPDGSPIEIDAPPGRVTVRDEGPGFPEADLPSVFDRFYRATGARSLPGSGLGLSIVREVAESHGGRATAGAAPGGGAEVSIVLPQIRADGGGGG